MCCSGINKLARRHPPHPFSDSVAIVPPPRPRAAPSRHPISLVAATSRTNKNNRHRAMLQLGGSRLKVSPFFKLKYTQREIIRFEGETRKPRLNMNQGRETGTSAAYSEHTNIRSFGWPLNWWLVVSCQSVSSPVRLSLTVPL